MVDIQEISPRIGDVLLMVGTMKGAFLFRSKATRGRWERGGPHFPGHAVYALAYDGRAGRRRLWAARRACTGARCSPQRRLRPHLDAAPSEATVKFPEDSGLSLKNIWQIAPGRDDDRTVLYCGVEPAALFVSRDAGATGRWCAGCSTIRTARAGSRAAAGCACTPILPDPREPEPLIIAISTGGVYRTEDGGRPGRPRNRGVRADFLPDKNPEFGQCVHKVVRHPSRPARLFLQNHWGLYRSDDGGESWQDIANGVPVGLRFRDGHPSARPRQVYIVPLDSDVFRCTPGAAARLSHARRRRSWERSTAGCRRRTRSRPSCATGCVSTACPRPGCTSARGREGVRLPRRR